MAQQAWINRVLLTLQHNGYRISLESSGRGTILRLIDECKQAETAYGYEPGEEEVLFTRVIDNHCNPTQRTYLVALKDTAYPNWQSLGNPTRTDKSTYRANLAAAWPQAGGAVAAE